MLRYQVLVAVMSLSLVGAVGHAMADGPDGGYGGAKVAQISFIDRALNLIQLSDGMELCAPDQHMLTAAGTDEIPGPAPTAIGGISNHS